MEKRDLSYTLHGNVNWYYQYGKEYGGSLKKLKIEVPYDSAIPLLGIYLEEIMVQKDTSTINVHSKSIYNCQDMDST